jgi:S1-C subfamily serine protease
MTRIAIGVALAWLACAAGVAQAAGDTADIEARLAAAQARLEAAANEIAALSTQLGEPMLRRMIIRSPGAAPPPLVGLSLDPGDGKEGVRVLDVSPGGPAAAAGVRQGDVIVSIDGEGLAGRERAAREATRLLRSASPGRPVKLKVLRAGKPLELAVLPRELHFDADAFGHDGPFTAALPMPPMPPQRGDFLVGREGGGLAGLEFVTLTPGLGQYFGADKGVLVVRAPKSGALQLQEGDVIQSIGDRVPRSGAHATRILASYQPGESTAIKVLRRRKVVTLNAAFAG